MKYTSSVTSSYDTVIIKSLALPEVPKVNGNYVLKPHSYTIDLDKSDLTYFKKIFELSPPKLGHTEGTSKGSGKGEVALYWLFNHQKTPILAEDSRKGSEPDLKLNGNIGCEIKSYENHNIKIGLGRFGSDKENIKLLNIIFGFYFIANKIDMNDIKTKEITVTNFSSTELLTAFKGIYKFRESVEDTLDHDIIKQMYNNVCEILDLLGNPKTPEQATHDMLTRIVKQKLESKPGDKGYMANIKQNGTIHMFYIDFNTLYNSSTTKIMNNVEIKQSVIYLNFKNIFG